MSHVGTRSESNWHGVELRHLIALRAVAAERSFSAAARSLGYTQSAVSGQILALERLIGARLFVRVRGTRPLELTHEGRILLTYATTILAQLRAAQQDDVERSRTRRCRASASASSGESASGLVPAICRRLGDNCSRRSTSARKEASTHSSTGSQRRQVDLAFVTLPTRDGPFEALPVCREPYTVVARRGEHVTHGAAVTIDELASLSVLTLDGCKAQSSLELVLEAKGHRLNVRKRLSSIDSRARVRRRRLRRRPPADARRRPAPVAHVAPTRPANTSTRPRDRVASRHDTDGLAQDIVDAASAVAGRPALQAAELIPRAWDPRAANPTPHRQPKRREPIDVGLQRVEFLSHRAARATCCASSLCC